MFYLFIYCLLFLGNLWCQLVSVNFLGLVPAEIYHKMERPGANLHEYSVTLGPLQVQIISGLPSKVKDLIRLIKYWEDEKMKVYIFPFFIVFHIYFVHEDIAVLLPAIFCRICTGWSAVLILKLHKRNQIHFFYFFSQCEIKIGQVLTRWSWWYWTPGTRLGVQKTSKCCERYMQCCSPWWIIGSSAWSFPVRWNILQQCYGRGV